MKRRDFLKGAAMVPAGVAAAQWSAAAEAFGAKSSRITAVVYDERYADCRVFAESLARQGAMLFPTGGDAARLWYGALRAHLARYGGGVAGMTTDCDLGVSRECGRELGMRIAYEGSHDGRTSNCLKHRLRGGDEANAVYAALLRADAPWAESIATALARPPLGERIINAIAGTPTITTPASGAHFGYLTSWLLTPLTRTNQRGQS
ncbi:MAG TPA: twin-arginine translocation signal domain-containing protein [Candidatus Acidoferrales bacterium]|nr:twin-arginine translocation signal domain-containing protein [Candidatus Acidoferrales bacterium]